MVRLLADLYAHVRQHGRELIKFGIVGGLGTIIDLGGAAVLNAHHVEPLESKAISIAAATVFTYIGSRYWTFRHRDNQPVHREAALFIALNAIGLVIAELVIAGTTYGLGLKGALAYNAASFVGTGLGTIFRWYAYRKWIFIAPAPQPSPWPPAAADVPQYSPWERYPASRDAAYPTYREPAYPAYQEQAYSAYPPAGPSRSSFIPNGSVASPFATAASPAGQAVRSAASPPPVPAAHRDPASPRGPGRHRRTR